MTRVWKATGKKPKALDIAPPPKELTYLWEAFCSVKRSPNPLTLIDIKTWADVYMRDLQPHEVDVILKIDSIYSEVNT